MSNETGQLPDFDLAGKVAVVTGASSGLGRHFALTLAAAGAQVVAAARRQSKLDDLVEQISSCGGQALAVSMDVTDRASVSAALDTAAATFGGIDILINNAGVAGMRRALNFTDADWDHIVGTNLTGAWVVAQEAGRRMRDADAGGSIINVTSILARRVGGGVSLYNAAKAGLQHLTRALAVDLADYHIRVNSLAPGYVVTDLNRDLLTSDSGEKMRARIPLQTFARADDLDGALLLLASPAGRMITGAEIVVDGGHSCNAL